MHLVCVNWPCECPHPLYKDTLDDALLFAHHIEDVHGVELRGLVKDIDQVSPPLKVQLLSPEKYGERRERPKDQDTAETYPTKRECASESIQGMG